MKNTIKIVGVIAIVAIIGFSIVACKGKSGSASNSSGADSASSQSSASAPSASSSSSLNKIDDFIADYEKFVDEYAVILKKAMAGDESVIMEAQKLGDKAQEWAKRWEGISPNDFTPAQAIKLQELGKRMESIFGN